LKRYHDRIVIDGALRDALLTAGCRKNLIAGAIALLRTSVIIAKHAGRLQPVFKTKWGTTPVDRYVSNWMRGDGAVMRDEPRREPADGGFAALILALR
jgi:hypothetical protein